MPETHHYDITPILRMFEDEFDAARALNIDVRTLRKWEEEGVDSYRADRAAVAVGRHPRQVWSDWWNPCESSPDGECRCGHAPYGEGEDFEQQMLDAEALGDEPGDDLVDRLLELGRAFADEPPLTLFGESSD